MGHREHVGVGHALGHRTHRCFEVIGALAALEGSQLPRHVGVVLPGQPRILGVAYAIAAMAT